ncbi:hypothetical protein GNQ08_27230 [Paenibacillus macerans]|uniref:Uncharacterized protein n=1 Tax=Paenibacillus macerans TaxID=44252 RepID=A0A6N8F2A4_PAEMA|nr:hypothetical protein [Paenibacillus macerans]MDU5946294.1 hypothetical protein [Paenibacillus macerans]MUG26059.1 hypothetical protein [Paenibacillus macerans]
MFYEFSHRHTPCLVDGIADTVILSRETKATTIIGKEYLFNGLFAPTSSVAPGSSVETDDFFLVQTMRLSTEKDKYCSLLKTNVTTEIQRYTQEYDKNDNPVGDPDFVFVEEAKGFAQFVTAQLRLEDPGLLPSTAYVLILQTSADIKRPQGLVSPDRVLLKGRPYQVDVVDDLKYPNLLHVQLSEDTR